MDFIFEQFQAHGKWSGRYEEPRAHPPPPASSPWTMSCINVASAERRGSRLVSRVVPCVPWVLQLRNGAVSPPAARSHGPRHPTGSSARAPHPLRPDSPGTAGLPAPSCWLRDDDTEWGPHSTQPSPAAFSRLARCSRSVPTSFRDSRAHVFLSVNTIPWSGWTTAYLPIVWGRHRGCFPAAASVGEADIDLHVRVVCGRGF